jgi:hypothetical protein
MNDSSFHAHGRSNTPWLGYFMWRWKTEWTNERNEKEIKEKCGKDLKR